MVSRKLTNSGPWSASGRRVLTTALGILSMAGSTKVGSPRYFCAVLIYIYNINDSKRWKDRCGEICVVCV